MQKQVAWLPSPHKEHEWEGGGRMFSARAPELKIIQMALLDFEMSWLFFQLQMMGHLDELACEAMHVQAQCPVEPQWRHRVVLLTSQKDSPCLGHSGSL